MRKRRAELAVLLVTIGLQFVVGLPVSLARTQAPVSKKVEEVPIQPTPNLDTEITALQQQLEENRQFMSTLRGQFEERRVAVEALAARLDERRAAEDRLTEQLNQLRQEVQWLRRLLYVSFGAIAALTLGLFSLRGQSLNYRTKNRRLSRVRYDQG